MIMLVIFIIGTVVMLFLPETLHQKLPETLRDAERFGKDQPFWYLPKPVHRTHSHADDGDKEKDVEITKDGGVLEKLNQPQFAT